MISLEEKAKQLSNLLYNRALDKAQIRDLSGAVDLLERSLQLDKNNIQARNLLGLIYFEMGEAVSALSEWVISKNLQPTDNLASEFIDKLQANQARLNVINQSIKGYNLALKNCREGNEDVAAITLRKVIAQNPKLIKAYHLLALIDIKEEKYSKANRALRRALKIDRTNSTTLRFLKETDGHVRAVTTLRKRGNAEAPGAADEGTESAGRIINFREISTLSSFVNVIMGVVIGILAAAFLIAPTVRQNINREANEKVSEYSNTMAAQEDQIAQLQSQVNDSKDTADSAKEQIDQADKTASSYENLLKAYIAYQDGSYSEASEAFQNIDEDLLSADAKVTFDSISKDVSKYTFQQLKEAGLEAFEEEDYEKAIDNLKKAMAIDDDDYAVIDYLAHAYRHHGDTQEAVKLFQTIVEKYPDTRRATVAQAYIDELGGDSGDSGSDENSSGENDSGENNSGDQDENGGDDSAETGDTQ